MMFRNATPSADGAFPKLCLQRDITLDAVLAINTYTVTIIDGATGKAIAILTVEHGSDAEAPEAPEHA